MPDIKAYEKYREQLAILINSLVTEKHNNLLIFGDKFPSLEEKWLAQGKKITHLKDLKKDYFEVTPENPDFNVKIEKNSFDLLISYHGIEKAIDPERLLIELRKYLVKEGDFICITYNVSHISSIINLFSEGWKQKSDGAIKEGNLRYFSYDSLKHIMKMAGFELIGEDIYALQENIEFTKELSAFTKNPYLNALSFILRTKRVEGFPFIDGTYP